MIAKKRSWKSVVSGRSAAGLLRWLLIGAFAGGIALSQVGAGTAAGGDPVSIEMVCPPEPDADGRTIAARLAQFSAPVPAGSAAAAGAIVTVSDTEQTPSFAGRMAIPEASPVTSAQIVPLPQSETIPGAKMRCGVYCSGDRCCDPRHWKMSPIPWEAFGHGEYVGPARTQHVPEYRLRVDDLLHVIYRLSGKVAARPYRLNVRDRLMIESLTAPQTIDRAVMVEPDGSITLRMLGQVPAAGLTLDELRDELEKRYERFVQKPTISVTPVELNSNLTELRNSVDSRYGVGGQTVEVRVTPEGTIGLPAVGSVPTQGLTLGELEREITERYSTVVDGLEVTPILYARAPRFVYVLGEVRIPGRYAMEQPTTVMQAIAMAGGWNTGAYLQHVVVLRRDENWQLMATKLDLHAALFGKRPCPADEIWLRDSDLVLLPKSPLRTADDFIELAFTRGLYGLFPMYTTFNFAKLSTI